MEYKHNKKLVDNAKTLRKEMTKEERHLWYDFLRDCEPKFVRQKIIGNYIVDFYCAKAKLVIELDGSQHFEDKAMKYDDKRTQFLEQYGLKVVRVPNFEINENFDVVCEWLTNIMRDALKIDIPE